MRPIPVRRAVALSALLFHYSMLAGAEGGSDHRIRMSNGWIFHGEVLSSEKDGFSKVDLAVAEGSWSGRVTVRREHVVDGVYRDEEKGPVLRTLLPPAPTTPERFAVDREHRPGSAIVPFGWRGDGSGRFPDAVAPSSFAPVWRLPMRSWTQSSAIVIGDLVYTVDDPHRLVCVDAAIGEIRWARANPARLCGHRASIMGYPRNDFARNTYKYTTPTPVADEAAVYAVFGHGTVVSYDHQGRLRWANMFHTEAKMRSGVSISPCLVGDFLIVGGAGREAMAAYDRATGDLVWSLGRPGHKRGKGAHQALHLDGRDFALMSTCRLIDTAGDRVPCLPELGNYGPTPCVQGNRVVAIDGGLHCGTLVTGEERDWDWQAPNKDSRSPLIAGERVYAATGKHLVAHALADGRELARVPTIGKWSSPAIAGDAIVQIGKGGKGSRGVAIQVVAITADGLEERHRIATDIRPARGPWDSGSSPVFDGNRMYFRGAEALWCLACEPSATE